ncbi:putative quinol monooxygenase [Dactylosporangium sp. NPDC051485]|uniref:putative quinol monooxygenase n=1 Tax=Dactylosporangium sp. NPDC051485 TaxID=3154846 RepID=UPI00343558E4
MSAVDLIARIATTPETFDRLRRLLEDYAQTVRDEPGNLRFELYASREDHSLVVVERYEDDRAFEQHCRSPENARFNRALQSLLGGRGSALEMLTRLDAQHGTGNATGNLP